MNYKISVVSTKISSITKNYRPVQNETIDLNSIVMSNNSSCENFLFFDVHVDNVKMSNQLLRNHLFGDYEEFLFKLFVNQRKVYRYQSALLEFENGAIDEEKFEQIENTCILTIKNGDSDVLKNKLLYFYELLKKYSPEEIDFLNNEDIAELISISENKLNNLEYRLNNANT